jgi:hypothetical protein
LIASLRGSKARAGCPLVKELAKAAGVGSRTVENDEDDNGAPFQSVEEYLGWRAVNRASRSSVGGQEGADLRERKLLAEAIKIEHEGRIKEIEARVKSGEFVRRDAVERWLSSFATEIRQTIESFTPTVVAEIPGDMRLVVNDILSEQVRLVLLKLASMDGELWADETVREAD